MTIYPAGKATDFPFDDEEALMAEEDALPPIPDWPSIFTLDEELE